MGGNGAERMKIPIPHSIKSAVGMYRYLNFLQARHGQLPDNFQVDVSEESAMQIRAAQEKRRRRAERNMEMVRKGAIARL